MGWVIVENNSYPKPMTQRLAVPGGWIYQMHTSHCEPTTVFVPDPIMADDTTYDRGYGAGYEAGYRDGKAETYPKWPDEGDKVKPFDNVGLALLLAHAAAMMEMMRDNEPSLHTIGVDQMIVDLEQAANKLREGE